MISVKTLKKNYKQVITPPVVRVVLKTIEDLLDDKLEHNALLGDTGARIKVSVGMPAYEYYSEIQKGVKKLLDDYISRGCSVGSVNYHNIPEESKVIIEVSLGWDPDES